MADALCWTCKKCNDSCSWVSGGVLPKGAETIEVTTQKYAAQRVTYCPDYTKDGEGKWNSDGYKALAGGIVHDALREYINALFLLKIFVKRDSQKVREARHSKQSVERFFRSEWFEELTDLQGEDLPKKLKKDVDRRWKEILQEYKETGKFPKDTPSIVSRNRKEIENELQ